MWLFCKIQKHFLGQQFISTVYFTIHYTDMDILSGQQLVFHTVSYTFYGSLF